ncbi:hypothetical protein DPM19_15820 [Actinomadura craniellae]|uniref:Uncharacterized protein n=1 Tax=Actinomadura craniellae TaxID=2231787 RepID=A0A365H5P1_9ACTN|nr:hypothetical protein DPM19_15820 [Actinomadura craniellae]
MLVAYNNAVNEANAADLELRNAEGEWGGAKDELIGLLKDLIGLEALENCLGEGDIVACLELVATAVPWGKFFKLLKTLPKAIKLATRLKNIWDRVSAARKRRDDAQDALRRAREALDRKKREACPVPAASRTGSYRIVPVAAVAVPIALAGPKDPITLGKNYTARADVFNTGGQASFEIHVYYKGREVGVRGPNGWIMKHGFKEPPVLPPEIEDNLNSRVNNLRQRIGLDPC